MSLLFKYSLISCLILINFFYCEASKLEFKYHSNKELEDILKKFNGTAKGNLRSTLYQIGYSSSKREPFPLWVLELTAASANKPGVPNVKLLGNVHGNEAGGREILLHFIEDLIDQYGSDNTITWLMDNTRIHILPTINPDGFKIAGNSCEGNVGRTVPTKDVDLNRDFLDYFHPDNPYIQHAKESIAVMKWMKERKFILSAALHGGAVVANYPYDAENPEGGRGVPHLTPDDDVFKHLARTYASNHPVMRTNKRCNKEMNFDEDITMNFGGISLNFEEGITNGAAWYPVDGGMGDYNYNFEGCMELTLELSCCKYPKDTDLNNLWNENRQSLLLYCMQANRGVTGRILDSETKTPVEAQLKIIGRDKSFTNFKKTGEFWRILLPGDYSLEVKADGYYTSKNKFKVQDFKKDFPKLTYLTIYLVNASVPTTTTTTTSTTISTPTETTKLSPITMNFTNRFNVDNDEKDENIKEENEFTVGELKGGYSKNSNISFVMLSLLVLFLLLK